MIQVVAQTGKEIALSLRGRSHEFSVARQAKLVANKLLGIKEEASSILVVAPRQSGKTTELLRFAEELYPNGQFAVICLNRYVISSVCHIYRDLRNDSNVSPPLMLLPDSLKLVGNESKPLFCDELHLFSEKMQNDIVGYRKFVAAVTS